MLFLSLCFLSCSEDSEFYLWASEIPDLFQNDHFYSPVSEGQ